MKFKSECGNATLEIALVFIPLMLGVVGICEVGRAMWTYHTLAMAVKTGARFASIHGARCAEASTSCPVSVASILTAIQQSGIGLDTSKLQLTLIAGPQTLSCAPASSCATNTTTWPPSPNNAVGLPVDIRATYSFDFVTGVFWPGQATGMWNLGARSTEIIEF